MSIKVTGNKTPFKGFEKKLVKELTIALEKSGQILEKESKFRVPVLTGRLQQSIGWIVRPISSGLRLTFGSGVRAIIAAYAKYIEYGTPRIQGVPFLRSAISDKKAKIERLLASAIRKASKP